MLAFYFFFTQKYADYFTSTIANKLNMQASSAGGCQRADFHWTIWNL